LYKHSIFTALLILTASTLCYAEDQSSAASADVSAHEYQDHGRMLFNWDAQGKVPFSIESHGRQVELHFEKPVSLAWGDTVDTLHNYIRQIETSQNGKTVIITLAKPGTAHSFLSYSKHGLELSKSGLDFIEGADMRAQTSATAAPSTPKSLIAPPQKTQADAARAQHAKEKKIAQAAKAKAQAAEMAAMKKEEAAELANLSPAAGTPAIAPPVPAAAPPAEVPSALPSATTPVTAVTPAASTPAVPSLSTPVAAPAAIASAPAVVARYDSIDLPIRADTASAVFIRQKTLWIVATDAPDLNVAALQKTGGHYIKEVQKIADSHATILRASLSEDVFASVGKSASDTLRLTLDPGAPARLAEPLLLSLKTNETQQSSLGIAAPKAERIFLVRDPASGEELRIVPLPGAGVGIAQPYSFVEFTLLQSAQGIVIQKIADDINVAVNKGAIDISAPKGLAISPEMAQRIQDAETETIADAHAPPVLFSYIRLKQIDDEKNFVPMQRKLMHDIAYANSPDTGEKARMRLLGLYIAQGLFPEARGMADDILRVSYKFYRDNKVAALRGAAYFFMYHIADAERDFSSPELAGDPEVAMWLGLCRELLGEPGESFNFLANYDRYIHNYPPVFIQKLAVIAADRSINRKEYDVALNIFDALRKDNLEDPVRKYIDFMRAKIMSETKNEDEAAKIWEHQAAEIDDPLIRARAEFSLVNMLLRQDKITHEDAIKRLEKLRIVWRGDSLEMSVLTLLGDLYIEDKQYAKALHTWRDIVLYYPEVPEAITTAKKMEATFLSLYNHGGADNMPPLEALSLFYEFRDLVPLGKEGDEMIRGLADRLVKIDLLDRAALLLDHQIRKRLQGDERSRVGANLALIYLLNHQPKEALETLKTTGYGDLPPDLKLTRLRLTAQALAQQGQLDKAIDVLSSDNSGDGTLLRLSIYWDSKDWPNVIATAEEVLGNRNDPSAPLTQQESDVLLKLATAYVYEHDTGQIQYLRDYFTPLLKNNPNKDSFLFVTSESGAIDYSNLANLDQDINAVKTFLDRYRDEVKKNGLSKTL